MLTSIEQIPIRASHRRARSTQAEACMGEGEIASACDAARCGLAGAIGIQRVSCEDGCADQGEDLDHCSISRSPIAAKNLPRDRFQRKSKMYCMTASLF